MKLSYSNKYLKTEEIPQTQGTTSTDFTKTNKPLFLQTISSNFSNQSKSNKIISRNNNKKLNQNNKEEKEKIFSPLKTFDNINMNRRTTIRKKNKAITNLTIDTGLKTQRKQNLKSRLIQNLLLPRNINAYTHLIRGKNAGNYAEIDWALRLRDYSQKINENKAIDYKNYYFRKKNDLEKGEEVKQEKIKLTENFSPPHFYEEDLQKYKNKIKNSERSLILKLNPNFYKINHLIFRNRGDHSNYSQFHFATTLRNIKPLKEEKYKINKFQILPLFEKNNNNNFLISKFLAPQTKYGKINLQKIEKYMSKYHDYKYEERTIEGQKIMKKIFTEDYKYTISGKGETLGDIKYNNIFQDNNMFSNKKILETETNPMCKFELSLRVYDDNNEMKSKTHRNFRQKKKK